MSRADLGRRAVACKHWRWMGGMAVLDRPMWRVVDRVGLPPYMVHGYEEESLGGMLPDLSDPATLGCLLHLVREAHGDGDTVAFVAHSDGSPKKWCVDVGVDPDFFDERKYVYGRTEAEALVVALEAAP